MSLYLNHHLLFLATVLVPVTRARATCHSDPTQSFITIATLYYTVCSHVYGVASYISFSEMFIGQFRIPFTFRIRILNRVTLIKLKHWNCLWAIELEMKNGQSICNRLPRVVWESLVRRLVNATHTSASQRIKGEREDRGVQTSLSLNFLLRFIIQFASALSSFAARFSRLYIYTLFLFLIFLYSVWVPPFSLSLSCSRAHLVTAALITSRKISPMRSPRD